MESMDHPRLMGGWIWTALGLGAFVWGLLLGSPPGPVVIALSTLTVIAAVAALTGHAWARWLAGRLLGVALGVELVLSVADRFGVLGAPGEPGISWGSWGDFTTYTGILLPWAPDALVTGAAVMATLAEVGLGVVLILGPQWRWAGKLTAGMLLCYLIAMLTTVDFGEVARYGVVIQIGAALLVSARGARPRSADRGQPAAASAG